MSFADLAVDTAVRADPEVAGRYHLTLPDHWDYLLPSGGMVMTAALRAAEAHLGDRTLRLASARTIFASPIHPGRCIADVHVIRRGRATAQVRVILRHTQEKDGEPGLELVATRPGGGIAAPIGLWALRCAKRLVQRQLVHELAAIVYTRASSAHGVPPKSPAARRAPSEG
jgi:hypothetical protein